jgi:hypothetical protein
MQSSEAGSKAARNDPRFFPTQLLSRDDAAFANPTPWVGCFVVSTPPSNQQASTTGEEQPVKRTNCSGGLAVFGLLKDEPKTSTRLHWFASIALADT